MFKIGKNAKTNTNNFKKEVVMVLVLFFIAILIIIMLILTAIIFSTIRISIKDLKISTNNIKNKTMCNTAYKDTVNKCNSNTEKSNYLLIFSLYFLNRIKFLSIKFDRKKMEKLITKMHLEKVDIQKLEREIKLSDIREVINIKPKVSYLNLDIKVGVDDVLVTTYIIPILCTVFTLVLPRVTKKENVMKIIHDYRAATGATVIIISHSMEDMALLADRLLVMNKGRLEMFDTTENVFKNGGRLREIGLNVPIVTQVFYELKKSGVPVPDDVFTVSRAVEALKAIKAGEKYA